MPWWQGFWGAPVFTKAEVSRLMMLLPGDCWLRRYVAWSYTQTDCPVAFALAGGLAALSSIQHPDAFVSVGARIYGNQYILIVGESGNSRKTTAVKYAGRMISAADPQLVVAEPRSSVGLYDGLVMQNQQCLVYEEFGDFVAHTTHGGIASDMREALTKLYDCAPTRHQYSVRSKRPTVVVDAPRVSLLGGVSPPLLESGVSSVDMLGGFMGRFLIIVAERVDCYPLPRTNRTEEARLQTELNAMFRARTGGEGYLSPEAERLFTEWQYDLHRRGQTAEAWFRTMTARAPGHSIRVAMAAAMCLGEISTDWQLKEDPMRFGIEVAELYIQSVGLLLETVCMSGFARDRKAVLANVIALTAARRKATLGNILTVTKPVMEKRDLIRVLETMVEMGLVVMLNDGAHPRYVTPDQIRNEDGGDGSPPPPITPRSTLGD